jgi:hypothetical protein
MVELRKRPSRDQPPAQPAAKRGSGSGGKMKKVVEKAKGVVGGGTSISFSFPICGVLLFHVVCLRRAWSLLSLMIQLWDF